MTPSRTAFRAFTLIELLTVIAIIAVLAAIIFPVFGRVREQSRQTQCMSQMHDIYLALKQYQADNQKYPAALLGFVENQSPTGSFYSGSGTPASIDQLAYRPLTKIQKYIKDKSTFFCPDNINTDPAKVVNAVWPQGAGVQTPGLPIRFTEVAAHNLGNESLAGGIPYFYAADSYDTGPQVDKDGNVVSTGGITNTELHYSLDWTGVTGPGDAPNQLKYNNPPEDHTVVTWCTYHVATAKGSIIPVLLLSGSTKAVPTSQFVTKGPLGFTY